jgi:alpha-tubulin suppressor-like RCC1 family protein
MKFNTVGLCARSLTIAALVLGSGASVHAEGWVVAWGDNSNGQITVPIGLSNAVAVAGGYYHSLAARLDGTVLSWGNTATPGNLTNVVALAGGLDCSLVLRADGTVSASGNNTYGQLNVPADLTNAIAVSAGWTHSLALRADSSVTAWGLNNYGQATVPLGLSNVLAVAANGNHSLALRTNGSVVAWGDNSVGQTSVPPTLGDIVAVAAGLFHNLALRANGTVVAWGRSTEGQATTVGLSNIVAVAGGVFHSLAIIGRVPPVITHQPASIVVARGATALFCVQADGSRPLSYQWQFNSNNIFAANSSCYSITNVQPSHTDAYRCIVSNAYGSTNSTSGLLLLSTVGVRMCGALTVDEPVGSNIRVEYTEDLCSTNWTTVTNIVSLPFAPFPYICDWDSAGRLHRFYRAVFLP